MGTIIIIIIIIIIIAVIIIIIISQVLLTSASYCGLHVRAVSVFGKKSDVVCGFFGVFLCGFSVFGPPLRPPPGTCMLFWKLAFFFRIAKVAC